MVKVEEFPQPLAGDEAKLLSGAGTWVEGALGRPNLDIVAPSTSVVKQQYRPMGWIIPATTLATKAQTVTNSAVKYLYVKMDNSQWNVNNAHFAGFITENVQ